MRHVSEGLTGSVSHYRAKPRWQDQVWDQDGTARRTRNPSEWVKIHLFEWDCVTEHRDRAVDRLLAQHSPASDSHLDSASCCLWGRGGGQPCLRKLPRRCAGSLMLFVPNASLQMRMLAVTTCSRGGTHGKERSWTRRPSVPGGGLQVVWNRIQVYSK